MMKLSCDGANIAASDTMVFLTFSFPGLAGNVLSAAGKYVYISMSMYIVYMGFHIGNHTYASLKGVEDYDILKACFTSVWEEVGANPVVYLEGQEYQLDIVFSSDYKVSLIKNTCIIPIVYDIPLQFLAIMTGLNKHICLCMVHSGKGQEVNIYTFLCNMCMHMYMKRPVHTALHALFVHVHGSTQTCFS